MYYFLKSLCITHNFCNKGAKHSSFCIRGSSFQNFPGEDTPGPPYIGRTLSARMFSPPTFNSFPSLCITNFITQIIVLSGPSKPGYTDSESQNFKKLGKHIPGLLHFRVCPPHFLERIVPLSSTSCRKPCERT